MIFKIVTKIWLNPQWTQLLYVPLYFFVDKVFFVGTTRLHAWSPVHDKLLIHLLLSSNSLVMVNGSGFGQKILTELKMFLWINTISSCSDQSEVSTLPTGCGSNYPLKNSHSNPGSVQRVGTLTEWTIGFRLFNVYFSFVLKPWLQKNLVLFLRHTNSRLVSVLFQVRETMIARNLLDTYAGCAVLEMT